MGKLRRVEQNHVVEYVLISEKEYADPFNDVEVSVEFTKPDGKKTLIPAFWSGSNKWCFRYSSHEMGEHVFCTRCSDASNERLHNKTGRVEVVEYKGKNPLFKHGPLMVAEDRRHLKHADGKPFFWLGDTWWMGFSKRLKWPGDFKKLVRDRVRKGFTVIQIVAGLYPDMAPFDPRGANEGGFPWEKDYTRINPRYFDFVDRRIEHLVQSGLVPCMVGLWGYYMEFAGEEVIKKHWRNLVARYYAYPVVWCLAGEATMPYYISEARSDVKLEEYVKRMRAAWTRIAKYVRSIDPHHNPVTIHPTDCAHNMVDDTTVIDIDMLQTGHDDVFSFENTVRSVTASLAREPRMPVLVGEVTYEGILGASWENVQRLMFWTSILNGAAGHTYGANGVWQVNTEKKPFGPSPHGRSWGSTPWTKAYRLPGSRQVGLGKRLLERYRWWEFKPHPEWVEPHWSEEDFYEPYAAGITGEVRVIYIPWRGKALWNGFKIKEIESSVSYKAFYFDPRSGREHDVGDVKPDVNLEWKPPLPETLEDWVLVLEKRGSR